MGAKINFTQEEIDKMIYLYYYENVNRYDIAKLNNISHGKLGNLFLEYHVICKDNRVKYKISYNESNEIADLYLSSLVSIEEILSKYSINRASVEKILKSRGISIRNPGYYQSSPMTELDIKTLIEDYKSNIAIKVLRNRYHLSEERFYNILKENNCEIRPVNVLLKTNLSNEEQKYMIDEYTKRGKSIDLISEEMGYSRPTITIRLQEAGIQIERGFARLIVRKTARSHGITGHYKGVFFRSMNELSFMINYLERKFIKYKSGEASRKNGIKYINELGQQRDYYPDFITDNTIFEVKPRRFWYNERVVLKSNAAKLYAKERGLRYRIVDYPIVIDPIINEISNGNVTFTDKGKIKFNRNYGKFLVLG